MLLKRKDRVDLFYLLTPSIVVIIVIYSMLKPSLETIHTTGDKSFLLRQFEEEAFSAPFHFHPEYELTLITKGKGTRYIGNHMDRYEAGDLLLLGPNLPHCWKTEPVTKGEKNAGSVVIQFRGDFLGAEFFSRREMININSLLEKSSRGLFFDALTRKEARARIDVLLKESSNLKRLLLFIELLQMLSVAKNTLTLNTEAGTVSITAADMQRIHQVQAYIIENFRDKVTLDKAAAIAHMTTNAFCKYYKKITRKTFMDAVIECRLDFATRQLIYTDLPVSAIGYESGFNDIAHFSRMFKQKLKATPVQYRKNFRKDL